MLLLANLGHQVGPEAPYQYYLTVKLTEEWEADTRGSTESGA